MNQFSARRSGACVIAAAITFVVGGGLLAPNIAVAQSSKDKKQQDNKNLMRNLGIGAGAAAVYEGLHGHTTNALVLGAGAALAGKKYEDTRKEQNSQHGYKRVYRYRNGHKIGYYTYHNGHRLGYHRLG